MSKSFGYTGHVWITFVLGIIQLPFHFLALQRLSPIIGDLNLRLHRVILLIAELLNFQQRHHWRTPLAPFLRRSDSLALHESIEDSHIGTSLTRVILNVKELETSHVLGSEIHLDVRLIEFHAPQARSLVEIIRLREHSCSGKATTEDLKVVRIEHARIFLDFTEVGIGLELSGLVRDNRDASLLHIMSLPRLRRSPLIASLIKVHRSVRTEMIDDSSIVSIGEGEGATGMGIVFAPVLATDAASSEVVHSLFHPLVTKVVVAAKGIVFVGSYLTEVIDKLLHLVDASPQFIAQSHHAEGRMMPIFSQDVLTLLMEECHQRFVLIIEGTPERKFWL